MGESFESPDKTHKRQKIGTRDLGPNNIIVDRRHFNRLKDTVCEQDETIKEMNNALTAKDDTITAKDNTTAARVTETATSSDEKNSLLDFQEAQHRAAIAELAVMGNGVSHRTLAQLLPFGTYFTMKRMHALGTLSTPPNIDDILEASPTHPSIGNSVRAAGHMNNLILEEELNYLECDSFFVATDAGNKGDHKWQVEIASTYSHKMGCVIERDIGCNCVDGLASGEAVAKSICASGERVGIGKRWRGACIDNAQDMITTFVTAMSTFFFGFIGCGCVLHILNLILVNAYIDAFGDEAMGVCSALRVGFMVHYLQSKFKHHWKQYTNRFAPTSKMCHGASKNRWWSIVAAFGDIIRDLRTIVAWME